MKPFWTNPEACVWAATRAAAAVDAMTQGDPEGADSSAMTRRRSRRKRCSHFRRRRRARAPRGPRPEGERERGAPGIEDIKGAMELGANAFNIVSVWRNRRLEDEIAKAEAAGDAEGAARMHAAKPGVILNVCKQRNGDFEGEVGL